LKSRAKFKAQRVLYSIVVPKMEGKGRFVPIFPLT